MTVGAAAVLLQLAAAQAFTYDLSAETEARGRATARDERPASGLDGRSANVSAVLSARVNATGRDASGSASYEPRAEFDTSADQAFILQAAALSATHRLGRTWSADVGTWGSYGTRNFLAAGPLPGEGSTPGRPQPLPEETLLRYGSASATAGVRGPLARRLETRVSLRAFVDGGLGPNRAVLPLERGAGIAAALDWTLDRSNAIELTSDASLVWFSTGARDRTATLFGAWRRVLTPFTDIRLGAGPTLATHEAEGQSSTTFSIGGEASIHHAMPRRRLDATLALRVAPLVDRVTGAVYQRSDVTGTASWAFAPRWLATATSSGGVVLDGPQGGESVMTGETRVSWASRTHWNAGGGLRWIHQDARAGVHEEWIAFMSLGFNDRNRL
jgi:hypothetical protein